MAHRQDRLTNSRPRAHSADGQAGRSLQKWITTSAALAGATSRVPAAETLVPYATQFLSGLASERSSFYASAYPRNGYAHGILIEHKEERPIKVVGNPAHPASLGATDVFAEAAILELWDLDRSQTPLRQGETADWEDFLQDWQEQRSQLPADGSGLALLCGPLSSPTLIGQIQRMLRRFPGARWYCHDPLDDPAARAGARQAYGCEVDTVYRFDRAKVVVSLDCDFLSRLPGSLRYSYDFMSALDWTSSRLYVLESAPGLAGALAEQRLAASPARIERFACLLARALGEPAPDYLPEPNGEERALLALLQDELSRHPGAGLVIAGPTLSPPVHALVHRLNARLGNLGRTVLPIPPVLARPGGAADLSTLLDEMENGNVHALFVLDVNPCYESPQASRCASLLADLPWSVHLGQYVDETALCTRWHIPATHPFEAWGDARAFDGCVSIVQPVIAPLNDGKSAHELLAALLGDPAESAYRQVRQYWQARYAKSDFDKFWRRALQQGHIAGTTFTPLPLDVLPPEPFALAEAPPLTAVFAPDPCIDTGRFANNAWLQELPKPLTRMSWSNAALLAPELAAAHGLSSGDQARLTVGEQALDLPVLVLPGLAPDVIVLLLGHGRRAAGRIGTGIGFDAYPLVDPASPWRRDGVRLAALQPAKAAERAGRPDDQGATVT
jgi:molybdopterin-containing oxidoreductase family iron-sulfur binding subunit